MRTRWCNEARGLFAKTLTDIVFTTEALAQSEREGRFSGSYRSRKTDEADARHTVIITTYPPIPTVKPRSGKFREV